MKQIIPFFMLMVSVIPLSAQITITKKDMITAGQMTVQAYDFATYPLSAKGANQTWNYSMLTANGKDTIHYGLASWYPGASNFPQANIASVYNAFDSSYNYLLIDSTGYTSLGYYETDNGTTFISKETSKIISFPSTYNTTYSDNGISSSNAATLEADIDGGGPIPYIDSINFTFDTENLSIIDGYGTIQIPLGNYAALRQNRRRIFTLKDAFMFEGGSWKTMPSNIITALGLTTKPDTSYNISFWTNDADIRVPLLQYHYNSGDTTTSNILWTISKVQASKTDKITSSNKIITYPNPCHTSLSVSLPDEVKANLYIYDSNGQLIKHLIVDNGSQVDLSDCNDGLYVFQYKDLITGQILQTQKIIKN